MKKIVFLFFLFLIAGCQKPAEEVEMVEKKVVFVISPVNFRDPEYLKPLEILEDAGVEAKVASLSLSPAKGAEGTVVNPDLTISDIDPDEFDGIILVGGSGASIYWDNSDLHQIIRKMVEKNKVVAAICIAPVTLAHSGVLKGKKATVWVSEKDNLTKAGALYTGKSVEVDGNIITANGPQASEEFGKKILEILK